MGWYDGVRVSSSNFGSMARSFFGIQLPVFGKHLSLRSARIEAFGYADQKNNSIVVRDSMLDGSDEFYGNMTWAKRLELFNAIVIHEAGHFKLSPAFINEFSIPGRKMTQNVATILQIIEDLYIENYIGNNFPYLEWFLINLNNALFTDEEIESRRNNTTGLKPETIEEAELIVHYAYSFKRQSFLFTFRDEWERTLYNMFVSVFGMNDKNERAKLAYKIYDYIFSPEQQEEESESSDEGEEEEESGNGSGEGKGNNEGSLDTSPEVSDPSSVATSMTKNGKTLLVKLPDYSREEVDNSDYHETYTVAVSEHKEIFVERAKGGAKSADFLLTRMDFTNLRVVENARGSVRTVVGAPAYSGRRMTHLHRAGMDGKIFGDIKLDGHRAGKGSPEIVFLLDFSGSMRSPVGGTRAGRGSKVDFAMSSAIAINNALGGTKTRFSIFGHTTTNRGGKWGVLFVEIKGFNEIVSEKEMINRLREIKGSVEFYGNADGAALLVAAKEFSKSHMGDKILFIVSDGAPAEDYRDFYVENGVSASNISTDYRDIIKNVAAVADSIRGRGIKLFSASIDDAAIEPCNQIYGKEHNVKVDNVSELVQMVVRALN